MRKLTDIRNRRFGKLTVIEYCPNHKNNKGKHYPSWKCLCDCQILIPEKERKFSYFTTNTLVNNKVVSCGCVKLEMLKKYNIFDMSHEYGVGFLKNGISFIFDKEDFDRIKNMYWVEDKDGYIVCRLNKKCHNQNIIFLSRFIMDCDDNYLIDHRNHNLKDNRKENLRKVSVSQNGMNKKIMKNNTSGVAGINKYGDKWMVRIQVRNKRINLGSFTNFDDAVKVRKQAEEKYFGEYSYDNSMKQRKQTAITNKVKH